MKNKKEFFGVIISVLVCVFIVGLVVYATTTVGNNVSVGGVLSINGSGTATEFSVLGTASISEDLWASGSFQFAGGEEVATASYSRLGSNTTGHSLADAYDLLIHGMLEADGAVWFDSTASVSSTLEASALKADTLSNSTGTLTINAFTLGGTIEGGAKDIISLGLIAATNASISSDLSIGATASISDNLVIGGGSNLFGGTASPTGATHSCSAGDVYFRSGSGTSSTTIYFCEAADSWEAGAL